METGGERRGIGKNSELRRRWQPGPRGSFGKAARTEIIRGADVTEFVYDKILGLREASEHPSFSIGSWENKGLKFSESSPELARFTELSERKIKSVHSLPGLWRTLCGKSGSGRLTRKVVVAGLGASVGAPVVAAAFASWGADAAAVLNQIGAFGAGYFASLASDWLRSNPKSDPTDEKNVRVALSHMLMAVQSVPENLPDEESVSESLRHLAVLLADPTVLGMIITIAATNGEKLRKLKPDTKDGANNDDSADDDWLLDEVVEILEYLARQPGVLEAALEQVYVTLQHKFGAG